MQVNGDSRSTAALSLDGRSLTVLNRHDYVEISMSKFPLPSVCQENETLDWLASLREGLHWNARGSKRRPDSQTI